MQNLKPRFRSPDGGTLGTLQSCIRTNDLDLVGDGTHLTHFQMLGNFSFGGPPYSLSVDMWDAVLTDLGLKPRLTVHHHPLRDDHRRLWSSRGYETVPDPECEWSDGSVGGHCCELFLGDLEIGNLVNPLGHSTDVGFGWERLVMVLEGVGRVDESSLFDLSLTPVQRDHVRCLGCLWENGVTPGNKGRNYVTRRLIRRIIEVEGSYPWSGWLEAERGLREKALVTGRKLWRRHRDKPPQWWWETCGLLPHELPLIG